MVNKEIWSPKSDIIHGFDERGSKVTVKWSQDGRQALVARGWVPDIQDDGKTPARNVDHVHVWNQLEGVPDHHDMRRTPKLYPDTPDKFS